MTDLSKMFEDGRFKREGKIAEAYIVAANVSGGTPKFFDQIERRAARCQAD